MTIDPLAIDTGWHWLAVLCYVGAAITNTYGLIFQKERVEALGNRLVTTGLVVHGAALVWRWQASGHGPYLARYEVLSSCAWVCLFLFLVCRRLYPALRQASLVVFPASFLLIAIGLFTNPEIKRLPPTFRSIWLVFHIGFYKIALATLLIALAYSLLAIVRKRAAYPWLNRLPGAMEVDLLTYRFAGFGFVFWAIAMLAGSIWAYQSWGRFWAWDPIETWSLITWLGLGIYLHLRRFFGWHGEGAAWLYLICFVLSLVSLFGVSLLTSSIHAAYFQ